MTRKGIGGRGGNANAYGEDSIAEGGSGGTAVIGNGGDGGDATAAADRSHAIGGKGGCGGIGPGGKGGNAHVFPDGTLLEDCVSEDEPGHIVVRPNDTYIAINGKVVALARGGENGDEGGRGGDGYVVGNDSFSAGGQGGEAMQPDGRGGRGGRAFMPDEFAKHLGIQRTNHMRWPYYEPITEPGRGGDSPDTPQYRARRLIVEQIKKQYFAHQGLPLDKVWWDREVAPLAWINEQLEADGYLWRASIVDDEYEFSDVNY